MEKLEKQQFIVDFKIEKQDENNDFFEFSGLASTFNKDTDNDIIQKGAFLDSISKELPVILFQHDQKQPIGVAIEAYETNEGLFLKAQLPKDDDLVRGRVIPQMRVGSLRKMSIGATMSRDDFELKSDSRIIHKMDLKEVSLVTFPANKGAVIHSFKSIDYNIAKEIKTRREFEGLLRELGVSQKAAVYLASKADFVEHDEAQIVEKINNIIGRLEKCLKN